MLYSACKTSIHYSYRTAFVNVINLAILNISMASSVVVILNTSLAFFLSLSKTPAYYILVVLPAKVELCFRMTRLFI